MACRILPSDSEVVAETVATMPTAHPESAHILTASLGHIVKVFCLLDDSLVIVMLALKDHLIVKLFSRHEDLKDFKPDVLLPISLLENFILTKRGISETLGISENIQTLDSS